MSQVVGIALVLATARLVVGSRAAWAIPCFAALSIGAHTQVGAVSLALAAPAVLVAAGAQTRRRFLLAAIAALVAGIALYLPGLLTMRVPLSWSKGSLEVITTFPRHDALDLL